MMIQRRVANSAAEICDGGIPDRQVAVQQACKDLMHRIFGRRSISEQGTGISHQERTMPSIEAGHSLTVRTMAGYVIHGTPRPFREETPQRVVFVYRPPVGYQFGSRTSIGSFLRAFLNACRLSATVIPPGNQSDEGFELVNRAASP